MNLLLVPTRFELDCLDSLCKQARDCGWSPEVCGFGPIAAAACAAKRISTAKPSLVMLLGIAGGMSDHLKVGGAYEFSEVVCHGIGIGSGENHHGLCELKWLQDGDGQGIPRTDTIPLQGEGDLQLLTCCAASSNLVDVTAKLNQFPKAAAEEMEGFGVALACAMHDVPLRIIRGISNRAGDRDKSHWQVVSALQAAGYRASRVLAGEA